LLGCGCSSFGGVPGPYSGGGQVSEASVRGRGDQIPQRLVWDVLHILGSHYSRRHRALCRCGIGELLRAGAFVHSEMASALLCSLSRCSAPCRQRCSRCLWSQNWPYFRSKLLSFLSC